MGYNNMVDAVKFDSRKLRPIIRTGNKGTALFTLFNGQILALRTPCGTWLEAARGTLEPSIVIVVSCDNDSWYVRGTPHRHRQDVAQMFGRLQTFCRMSLAGLVCSVGKM
jgi:hypothetical protein